MLTYDDKYVQFSRREKYMPYDREVYDGVVTLYEAENDRIIPAMVYRAMIVYTKSSIWHSLTSCEFDNLSAKPARQSSYDII